MTTLHYARSLNSRRSENCNRDLNGSGSVQLPASFPRAGQITVAGEAGLRALIALSRCEDLELRILAAGALRHLSLNTRVKRPMVEEGALGPIIRQDEGL